MSNVVTLTAFQAHKKRRTREKVFEALETIHMNVIQQLKDEAEHLDANEMEEFYVQVIADHLLGNLASEEDLKRVTDHYMRFDNRLRDCLQNQIKTFRRFM